MAWSTRPENKSYLIRARCSSINSFILCSKAMFAFIVLHTPQALAYVWPDVSLCVFSVILTLALNKPERPCSTRCTWRCEEFIFHSFFCSPPNWLDNKRMISLWKWLSQSGTDTWHSYSFNYRVHYYLQSIFHPSNVMAFHRFWWHFLS